MKLVEEMGMDAMIIDSSGTIHMTNAIKEKITMKKAIRNTTIADRILFLLLIIASFAGLCIRVRHSLWDLMFWSK